MQYLGTIDKAKDIINKDFVEKLLGDYQPLINESSKLPYSLISGVPTSLPASDVYPWAKASTKPSYSYSEITGAISTTELQNYLTSNSYLNVTSGDNRYLKLSGGTLDGVLTLRASNSSSDSWIEFSNKSNSVVHKLGVRRPESSYGLQYYNGSEYYKIWHEGNDGPDSGLDADLLDGLHNGELTALVLSKYSDTWNYSLGNPGLSVFSDWNNTQSLAGYFYGISIESVDNRFRTVLATPLWTDGLHWRRYSNGDWQEDWRCLIDSYNIGSYNAGSATKLQTARTIWGQSFDGTGDVSGRLDMDSLVYFMQGGTAHGYLGFASSDTDLYLNANRTLFISGKNNLILNGYSDQGNVGIGTTNPSQKLEVNGHIFANMHYFKTYNDASASAGYIGVPHSDNNNIAIVSTTSSAIEFITSDYSVPRMIVMPNGNVGIGTTSPTKKLHIYDSNISNNSILLLEKGNAYDSRLDLINSVDSLSIIQQSTGNAFISLRGNHSLIFETSNSARVTIDSSGSVGIGTQNPSKKLHIYSDSSSHDSLVLLEKGGAYDVRFELANSIDALRVIQQASGNAFISLNGNHSLNLETSNTVRFTIDGSGNVGIGTASPSYKLDVNGTISVNSSDAISLKLNSSKTDWGFAYNSIGIYHSNSQKGGFGWNSEPAGLSNVGFYFKNYVSGDCISLFNEGGICFIGSNVGIGTASPTYKLDVKGEIRMSGAGIIGGGLHFTGIGSGTYNKGTIMSTTTYGYEIEAPRATDSATGTALPIFIGWRGGALGIKITSGGNLLANGGITMYSDQRKKTILNHVELSLKDIANAPLIEHYYNSDESKTTHVGSIAQYWASMNDWFCKLDSEGYYTMEIQNAALASAISIARELDRYETKTDKAIKKLKKRICELEEEVERLKSA